MNINNLIISGWVQTNPKEVITKNGKRNARFSVTNVNRYSRADGSSGENKIFFDVVAWGDRLVDRILDTVHKNSEIIVEGALSVNSYVDREGKRKFRTECIARKVEIVEAGEPPSSYDKADVRRDHNVERSQERNHKPDEREYYDDDIPF